MMRSQVRMLLCPEHLPIEPVMPGLTSLDMDLTSRSRSALAPHPQCLILPQSVRSSSELGSPPAAAW